MHILIMKIFRRPSKTNLWIKEHFFNVVLSFDHVFEQMQANQHIPFMSCAHKKCVLDMLIKHKNIEVQKLWQKYRKDSCCVNFFTIVQQSSFPELLKSQLQSSKTHSLLFDCIFPLSESGPLLHRPIYSVLHDFNHKETILFFFFQVLEFRLSKD